MLLVDYAIRTLMAQVELNTDAYADTSEKQLPRSANWLTR